MQAFVGLATHAVHAASASQAVNTEQQFCRVQAPQEESDAFGLHTAPAPASATPEVPVAEPEAPIAPMLEPEDPVVPILPKGEPPSSGPPVVFTVHPSIASIASAMAAKDTLRVLIP
jgi:hypothetical protein